VTNTYPGWIVVSVQPEDLAPGECRVLFGNPEPKHAETHVISRVIIAEHQQRLVDVFGFCTQRMPLHEGGPAWRTRIAVAAMNNANHTLRPQLSIIMKPIAEAKRTMRGELGGYGHRLPGCICTITQTARVRNIACPIHGVEE
jgi:hypothetical protein